jgi:hypothetical protein
MSKNPKNKVKSGQVNQANQKQVGGSSGMKQVNSTVSSIITIFFLAALVLSGVFDLNGAVELGFRLLGATFKATEISIKSMEPRYRTNDEAIKDEQILPADR